MRRRTFLYSVAGLAVATAGCSGEEPNQPTMTPVPVGPVSVSLTADGLPEQCTIGVVVSLGSRPGEGTDWLLAAEGAEVAAERFRLGGHDLRLSVIDDRGSTEGTVEAVTTLADQGVAGIVLATTGSHVQQGIAEAVARQVPMVMPYLVDDDHLVNGAWATGPLRSTRDAALAEALTAMGSRVIQITGVGAQAPAGLELVSKLGFDLSERTEAEFIKELTAVAVEQDADAVLIVGDAGSSAEVATAVRRAGLALPILLTEVGRSPLFSSRILTATGSLNGSYRCVGLANDDPASSRQDETGRAATAFLEAVERTSATSTITRYFEDAPFSDVAYAADAASHDAVVALVRAAAEARSASPAVVLAALPNLKLTHEEGLVGAPLDFSTATAVPDGAIVPLVATADFSASRPGDQPMLRWFEATEDD